VDYTGLFPSFKVDRRLTEEERSLQLKQQVRLDVVPIYQAVVVRMNSTYLETADKFYTWKGRLTFGMILVLTMVGTFFVALGALAFASVHWVDLVDWSELRATHLFVILGCLGSPLVAACVWGLRREAFRHTHYPLRFNRKTRMVHAFRYDGSVLSANWDELFFTLGRGNRHNLTQSWDVRMHVLDADGVTVRDTLALGLFAGDVEMVRRFWELHRRYMEEGPESICKFVEVFMPIAEHRETFMFGLRRYWSNFVGSPAGYYLMAPVVPLFAIGRWIAMRTSKVPTWPADIEAECAIDANDPFRRDSRDNPADLFG